MFNWFYKRLAKNIWSSLDSNEMLVDFLKDEENQKVIIGFTDALYERYKQKVMGTVGGLQKGLNYAQGEVIPNILDSRGHLSLKGIAPLLIQSFMGKQGEKPNSTLP